MLKIKHPTKILAIDQGNRYLGIAVFANQQLIYCTVKFVASRNMAELLKKVREIITELIFTYSPDMVVQEKIFYVQCKNSEKFKKLSAEIKRLVKKIQLDYLEYTPPAVRKQICGNDKATKKDTFEILVSLYPELSVNLTYDQLWKNSYWAHMLDAVALGLCCWQNLK